MIALHVTLPSTSMVLPVRPLIGPLGVSQDSASGVSAMFSRRRTVTLATAIGCLACHHLGAYMHVTEHRSRVYWARPIHFNIHSQVRTGLYLLYIHSHRLGRKRQSM